MKSFLLVALFLSSFFAAAQGPVCSTFSRLYKRTYFLTDIAVLGDIVCSTESGYGILLSTDGGKSFVWKNTTDGLISNQVNKVYVTDDAIYVATKSGISISKDRGKTFFSKTDTDGLRSNDVRGIYSVGDTLYAATISGLCISTDRGASFSNATGLGTAYMFDVFAIGKTVYGVTRDGVYKSIDGGISFSQIYRYGIGRGPIYAINVHAEGENVYISTFDTGLLISRDGGKTFTAKMTSEGLPSNYLYDVYAIGSTVYVGTRYGLAISTDSGNSFVRIGSLYGETVTGVCATTDKIYVSTIGDVYSCQDINASLPVQLVSFSAMATPDQSVSLEWKTAGELHNARFEVQRSKDLIHFEPVTTINDVAGTTAQTHNYQLVDKQPYSGTSYYQLTQIDQDGNTTSFRPVSVVVRKQAYGVYPNPVTTQTFSVSVDEVEKASIRMINAVGKPVGFTQMVQDPQTVLITPQQTLRTGSYLITVDERATTRSHRVIIP